MSGKLIAVGYWESEQEPQFPHPKIMEGLYEDKVVQKSIVDYLNLGLEYVRWRGLSWCRFKCGIETTKMGSRDLTDGYWIWPEGLSHYVAEHNVILPGEFINHM